MYVAVIGSTGKKLQPTSSYRARKLLNSKRAKIYSYRPIFTIQLLDREDGTTQPIELKMDTGYQYIGVSICSKKHEYVNRQYDMLPDEAERHNDCRKYRRTRRNKKRYREARWNNRKSNLVAKGKYAPSIRHKKDIHVNLYKRFQKVIPITTAVIEAGQFDTQVLKAVEEGNPLPQGTDYQQGERYGFATLKEAVLSRDNYQCICCGKGIKESKILSMHHLGYRKGDRSNRMSNLATVCTDCHASKNHQPGGKLYDLKPQLKNFKGATFMSTVRWDMVNEFKNINPTVKIIVTYGAMTKLKRADLNIKKTHSNDAYAMGNFHPKHRSDFEYYQKCRRNNRILCKFYDAKYTDVRDGSIKSGKQIGCNRTNRRELRNSDKNERIYRGYKIKKGRNSIRQQHYSYRPGDIILYQGQKYTVAGINNKGKTVTLKEIKKVPSVKKVQLVKHVGGWRQI